MSFGAKIIQDAVDLHFCPPNAARAARRQVFVVAGTVVLVVLALDTDGPLAWLLWAWVAYRAFVFFMLLVLGPQMADELTRRLNSIPPALRAHLSGGAQ